MTKTNSTKKGPGSPFTVKGVEGCMTPGRFADGPENRGLYLQISIRKGKAKEDKVGKSAVVKSWIFRYQDRVTGKERLMGLGSFYDLGLKEAREFAAEQRELLRKFKDPLRTRESEMARAKQVTKSMITFEVATNQYWQDHKSGWKNEAYRNNWINQMKTHVFPKLGEKNVTAIEMIDVYDVLKPIWTPMAETASRIRQRIEAVLDWCKGRKYLKGDNVAAWKGNLDTQLPPSPRTKNQEHHPSLPYAELAAFMTSLRTQAGVAALSLEFTILTACRTNEVIGATWKEFDLDRFIWTIPEARMKAGKEHVVVLSPRAVEIVKELEKTKVSDFVFPGEKVGKPQSNAAMAALLKRMKRLDITVHGFRSTFSDWARETTNYPIELIEHALAHRLKDKAEAAYARGSMIEKRYALMADWAKFTTVEWNASANVIPIRAAQ